MTKPSQTPRAGSTPAAGSVNKWKIPHYYRRSSASQQSIASDPGNTSTPNTPGVNVMNSPKKVLLEDPKKSKKRVGCRSRKNSRNKSGEMVFVNYTVQDSGSDASNSVRSESTSASPMAMTQPLSPTATPIVKKKSSRSRMLKIFGSSKDPPSVDVAPDTSEESMLSSEGSSNDTFVPKSASFTEKRSYSSFLKYGRVYGSSASIGASSSPALSTPAPQAQQEVVPRSSPNPKLVKPITNTRDIFQGPGRGVHLFRNKNKKQSALVVTEHVFDNAENEAQYMGRDKNFLRNNAIDLYSNNKVPSSEPSFTRNKTTDENDASIAFSKMFTRKRANTGGSMSSFASLNKLQQQQHEQQLQQQNLMCQTNMIPSFEKNMSMTSISSLSNRYSPIRTASPARPRSITRGSSSNRLSRDLTPSHTVSDLSDISNGIFNGTESFLDTQIGSKNSNSNSQRHKRKQDSISDLHKTYTPSTSAPAFNNSSTVVTPSSSSLVTPPAFTSGYTIVSSTSASSTPSVLEPSQPNQIIGPTSNITSGTNPLELSTSSNVASSMLDRDSSSEVLFEDSDFPTPLDNLPALKGIPRTTLEEEEEDEEKEAVEGGRLYVNYNSENLDFMQLAHGGSTSSSQVDSVLTNSVFSITDTSLLGKYWQDQSSYTITNMGLGSKDVKVDNFGETSSGTTSKLSTATTVPDRKNLDNVDKTALPGNNESKDKVLKMCMEFDFENPNSFFQEQTRILGSGSGHHTEHSGVSTKTLMEGQNSAVTSVANVSPGTAATLSFEDIAHSASQYRSFHDQANNHANSMPSLTAASNSLGPWKAINNDLDAIADSCYSTEDMNDISYI